MGGTNRKRPSPATVISIVALAFAITGTAVAGVATVSVLSKKEKKQTRSIARGEINKAAPGLTVANAKNADAAANAGTLQGKPASAFAASASEPYHEVDTPGEPPLENAWVNEGDDFSTAGFYKDPLGVVHLKGSLFTNEDDGTAAFTLPLGYRPSQHLFMPAAAGQSAAMQLIVETDGDVLPFCDGAGGGCSVGIDGLTFRAQ